MSSVIPGDIVDAMWDVFTTPKARALVRNFRADPHDEALAVLDVSEVGPSFVGPDARYFIVQIEDCGRQRDVYLQAMDRTFAGCSAMERYPSTPTAQVVREISREEFERLTKRSY